MRHVTERAAEHEAEYTEGVRVHYADGWALVLPDASEPTVTVWAEAASDADAQQRVDEWRTIVEAGIALP
jgi:mannose-1-phosphate guanylyltransferase/phosphomannomutase